jgi:hypothetical protein
LTGLASPAAKAAGTGERRAAKRIGMLREDRKR